jgi:hypothetical protein
MIAGEAEFEQRQQDEANGVGGEGNGMGAVIFAKDK